MEDNVVNRGCSVAFESGLDGARPTDGEIIFLSGDLPDNPGHFPALDTELDGFWLQFVGLLPESSSECPQNYHFNARPKNELRRRSTRVKLLADLYLGPRISGQIDRLIRPAELITRPEIVNVHALLLALRLAAVWIPAYAGMTGPFLLRNPNRDIASDAGTMPKAGR
jgi:hypothetical protein